MHYRSTAVALLTLALVAGLAGSCDEATNPGPTTGAIRVSAVTGGSSIDPDGYTLTVGTDAQVLAIDQTRYFPDLDPGAYVVELSGVASNCTVDGDNPRTLSVIAGATAATSFTVACVTTTGTLRVIVTTSGPSLDVDPDGYTLTVGAEPPRALAINETVTYAELDAGSYILELAGMAANCTASGDNPRTASVAPATTTVMHFAVNCAASTGSITVRTVTTGASLDADGYALTIAGADPRTIPIDGASAIAGLEPGDHQLRLTGVAPNCAVDGANPRVVSVAPGQVEATTFGVVCAFVQRDIVFTTDRNGSLPCSTCPIENRGEIYAIDADGSGLVRLTRQPGWDAQPAWSPDGTRIAYTTDRHGGGLGIMDAGGTNPVALTHGWDADPAWSPDGRQIAFTRDESGWFDLHIYVVNPDGSGPVRLDSTGGAHPAWSPDGANIAFTGDADIYVMDADGSHQRNLTNGAGYWNWSPAWSPDGTRIAFTRSTDGNVDIYVMNADGSNPINLTNHPAWDSRAAWSPDGSKIVFATNRDGNAELYVMDADGSNPVNLTNHPGSDWGPAWTP